MKRFTQKLCICFFTIIISSTMVIISCSSEPVTTTKTQTVTLPPETITKTISEPQTTLPNQIVQDITVAEAFAMILDNEDNPEFTILDVRTPEEHAEGFIPGAILIDFRSDTWLVEVGALDKNDTYLVYCRSGNRSTSAVEDMRSFNFAEVYNMQGGISAWIAAGYPVITPVTPTLSPEDAPLVPHSLALLEQQIGACHICHFLIPGHEAYIEDEETCQDCHKEGPRLVGNVVTISDSTFNPSEITILVGGEITWINLDNVLHTATSDELGIFNSRILSPGDFYKHTFSEVGVFNYHSETYPEITGTIKVVNIPTTTWGELAIKGKIDFDDSCVCHGDELNKPILEKYDTADKLFNFISTQMPANNPSTLSTEVYLRVLAYLLVENTLVQPEETFEEINLDNVSLSSGTTITTPPSTTTAITGPPPTPASELMDYGQIVFKNSCGVQLCGCHAKWEEGGKEEFAGPNIPYWGNVQKLFNYVSTYMPGNHPGILTDLEYLQVLAFILVENNWITPEVLLGSSTLSDIPLTY
ncbi:MAG: hypothetical protein JSV74_03420 [Dehalococcoidia bacterium]|nr:MAG: hypothetical protein JSV74_03420 [Dehalococcoidia bacterium]